MFKEPAKESVANSAPSVKSPTGGTKLHNCSIYREGLGQSHAGLQVVGLVSVRPYEPTLVAYVGFLWCLDPMALYYLFSPSSAGFLELGLMFGCGS